MDGSASVLPEKILSLEQQVARLQALLEASRQVHSAMVVEEVLTQTARFWCASWRWRARCFWSHLRPRRWPPTAICRLLRMKTAAGITLVSKENQPLLELVVAPPAGEALSLYEQDFVEGLVLQTTVALENATLHERDLKWARVQQDLDAARSVQSSLLPREMPEIASFSIAGRSTACYEVGGDYMDTMRLADGVI